MKEMKLYPILKWAGGKERELKYIIPNLPSELDSYYEPFVGGGSVFTAITANKYFINDKSDELISLYMNICGDGRNLLFDAIEEIIHNWGLLTSVVENNSGFFVELYVSYSKCEIDEVRLRTIIREFISTHSDQFNGMFSDIFTFDKHNFIKEIEENLIRKIRRMRVIEQSKGTMPDIDIQNNVETSLKSAFYMHFRYIYNHSVQYNLNEQFQSAVFLFIRNFAYSGMFRYNSSGKFNVPYGGMGYNRNSLSKKLDYFRSTQLYERLSNTVISNCDFEEFLHKYLPTENDFMFVDPPYDTEFSTYAQNVFDNQDQSRLAKYLITECKAKWMLIIKNTEFINSLYDNAGLNIKAFDKKYQVSFMNRNDKSTQHLLITNY